MYLALFVAAALAVILALGTGSSPSQALGPGPALGKPTEQKPAAPLASMSFLTKGRYDAAAADDDDVAGLWWAKRPFSLPEGYSNDQRVYMMRQDHDDKGSSSGDGKQGFSIPPTQRFLT